MKKIITVLIIVLFFSTLFAWTYVTRIGDEQPASGELVVYINADTQPGENVAAEARWPIGSPTIYVNTRDQGTKEYGSFLGGAANWKVTFNTGVLPNDQSFEYQVMGIGGDGNFYSHSGFNWIIDGALPVELTTFTAVSRNNVVELNWETATEVNNFGFDVERKTEIGDWSNIGFVEGFGNSNSPKIYSFSETLEEEGKYSYRLKQMDIDGSFEYSSEVEILVEKLNEFKLNQNYPNPFNPGTKIKFNLTENSDVKVTVYNIVGEKITELFNGKLDAGEHEVEFDGSKLQSGVYVYSLESNEQKLTKKMLLLK